MFCTNRGRNMSMDNKNPENKKPEDKNSDTNNPDTTSTDTKSTDKKPASNKPTGGRKFLSWRNALILLGIAALGVGLYFLTHKKPKPEGLIQVNGRIEGDVILISSKYNGKIQQLFAREGDHVAQQQVVVSLDDPETRDCLAQEQRNLNSLIAQSRAAGQNIGLTSETGNSDIDQARGGVTQADSGIKEAQAAAKSAAAEVTGAEAAAKSAAAEVTGAEAAAKRAAAEVTDAEAEPNARQRR